MKKNFQVEGGESDSVIKEDVKNYIKHKNKTIRVMNIRVVRNRLSVDSVGCKLFVPNNSVWKITDSNFWPDHIEFREWQVYKPRKYDYRDNEHNDYYNGGEYGDAWWFPNKW